MMQNIAPIIKDFVGQSVTPVLSRLDDIERRFSELPVPRDGKDADIESTAGVVFLRLQPEIENLRKDVAAMQPALSAFETTIKASVGTLVQEIVDKVPKPQDGKDGVDGKSVTVEDVAPLVETAVAKQISALPTPKDGEDGKPGIDGKGVAVEDVEPLIVAEIAKRVAEIPVPKDGADGKSLAADDILPLVERLVTEKVAALPPAIPGEPGKSVTMEDVAPLIGAEVEKRIAAMPPALPGEPGKSVTLEEIIPLVEKAVAAVPIPTPQDGKSITVEDVAPLILQEVTKQVSAIPVPKDGIDGKNGADIAGALIDRDGNLVVTLTNGAVKELGKVCGSDGRDAEPVVIPELPDIDTVPDDLNERIAKAVRLMAETPVMEIAAVAAIERKSAPGSSPVHIHLPKHEIANMEIVMPKMEPQLVTVEMTPPKKRSTRTIVEEHDTKGRVKKFRQEEID
jgi:hypothetical protein